MQFKEGQAVLGKIRFRDGQEPQYPRPYLVVTVTAEYIEVLNVSSIQGKDYKLAYSTNTRINPYNPPFMKPSFVKLDSLTRVDSSLFGGLHLLAKGAVLDAQELNRIKSLIK